MRDKLLGWLDGERDRQLEFLRAFTRIDTCNPPGDTRDAADFFRRAHVHHRLVPARERCQRTAYLLTMTPLCGLHMQR